jgi:segregation and condensation protein B
VLGCYCKGEAGESRAKGFINKGNPVAWWKRKKEPLKEPHGEKSAGGSPGDLRLLEAILMVINEPISAKQLGILTGFPDPTSVRAAVSQMNQNYDRLGRGYRIEEVAGGLQLLTRKQFALWIRRSDQVPPEQLLSPAMLETLSIIAYRQPVIRAEIESIRGVACDEVLRQLIQRDLVRISGREEELGRPFLYETTKTFLKLFGLKAVDNLPRFQKILQQESEIASRIRNTLTDEPSER